MTDREFAFNFLPTILVLENGKIKNNIGFWAKKILRKRWRSGRKRMIVPAWK